MVVRTGVYLLEGCQPTRSRWQRLLRLKRKCELEEGRLWGFRCSESRRTGQHAGWRDISGRSRGSAGVVMVSGGILDNDEQTGHEPTEMATEVQQSVWC